MKREVVLNSAESEIVTVRRTSSYRRLVKNIIRSCRDIRSCRLCEGSRGGATVIKLVRQNDRGTAGAEASTECTRMEAP